MRNTLLYLHVYHIVYLTTNLVNNKMYVGVHSTYDLNDGYLGSGKALKLAIKKYGEESFKREILHFCLNAEDAYQIESKIIDEHFINRNDTYNIKLGGIRGPIAYGQANPCSKTKMSEERRKAKDLKRRTTREPNNHLIAAKTASTRRSKATKYILISPDNKK